MKEPEAKEQRKQHEIMCRVLANSVVTQLASAGCSFAQLLEFGGEVLACINRRSFGVESIVETAASVSDADLHVLPYRLEPVAADRHRIHGPRVMLRPLEDSDRGLLETWRHDELISHASSRSLLEALCSHASLASLHDSRRDFVVSARAAWLALA